MGEQWCLSDSDKRRWRVEDHSDKFEKSDHPDVPPMIWQSYFAETHPHLTKKMKKKTGPIYDSNGMLVQMSKRELEDAQNQWVEDDGDEGDIDGVEPGKTISEKAQA